MPLIIITGFPSSGKTKRTNELKAHFESRNKIVKIISENHAIPKSGFCKNEYFNDSQKEKIVRAYLKSDAIRLMNKEDVVILDAGNYIKGYRYELYCASKAARTTQCTIYCALSSSEAWEFNQQRQHPDEIENSTDEHDSNLNNSSVPYTREIFDLLIQRYEEPIANNRWDAPLFTILVNKQPPFEEIFSSLYEKQPPPPNLSTQNVSEIKPKIIFLDLL